MANGFDLLDGQNTIRSIASHYRSGTSSLGQDFFAPCLQHCVQYQRAVGYFSSKALMMWLEVLPWLADRSATIHLLISPELSAEDRQALEQATDEVERHKLRAIAADRLIREIMAENKGKAISDAAFRLKLFAWMVANDHLILQFAFPEHIRPPA